MADYAYREIRDRLVMLDIRPGSPINEEQLGADLGLGRTPVREALKWLAHEHLVVIYPRRGTFATDVQMTDLAHISEVRRHLEPVAAAAAATRADTGQRELLTHLAEELRASARHEVDVRDLMRMDLRAHRAIYAAMGNPFLEDTMVRYDNLANRIWCLLLPRLDGMAGHVHEHIPLLEAVIAGRADLAGQLAREHVEHFESKIRTLI